IREGAHELPEEFQTGAGALKERNGAAGTRAEEPGYQGIARRREKVSGYRGRTPRARQAERTWRGSDSRLRARVSIIGVRTVCFRMRRPLRLAVPRLPLLSLHSWRPHRVSRGESSSAD